MSKKWDRDVLALKRACVALERSKNVRALYASIEFIVDRYVKNPPKDAWWIDPRGVNPK